MEPSALTLTLDLCGVFVFALSGALAAVFRRLDVAGVPSSGANWLPIATDWRELAGFRRVD